MSRQYLTKPARSLRHTSNWLRSDKGGDNRALGQSYLARPLYPIICNADLEILDGNRRLEGVLAVKPDAEVPIRITDEPFSPTSALEIQLESSEHTKALGQYERYCGYSGWMELNPGATARQLAERIHQHESTVSKILSLGKCIPAVHDAARAGLIGQSDWSEIGKLPTDEQPALLAFKLDGKSRDDVVREGRKRRNGNGQPVVRCERIKCPLPSGVVIVASGAELSIEDFIEALAAAIKEARDAVKLGLDSKTFQAVARDKARAGG